MASKVDILERFVLIKPPSPSFILYIFLAEQSGTISSRGSLQFLIHFMLLVLSLPALFLAYMFMPFELNF